MDQCFHAHVYYDQNEEAQANALYSKLQSLAVAGVTLGNRYSIPVGPHALPMFVIFFRASAKSELLYFLHQNRNELRILIHEDTGDDYLDHTVGALWLGEALPIRFEHFERIKNEKSALVFPE